MKLQQNLLFSFPFVFSHSYSIAAFIFFKYLGGGGGGGGFSPLNPPVIYTLAAYNQMRISKRFSTYLTVEAFGNFVDKIVVVATT